ncbi:hypothetical protein ACO0QE_003512 [Hanseniaspora vineae]
MAPETVPSNKDKKFSATKHKKIQQSKKFTKEYKIAEIKKSLHKKARLKKNYFKALKDEGYSLPDERENQSSGRKSRVDPSLSYKERKDIQKRENIEKLKALKQQKKDTKYQQKLTKEERRQKELDRVNEIKKKNENRQLKRERLTQTTRRGQPLMGPKIEDLLNKIKTDDIYK